ncbi:acyl-CoA synthetase [Erythrobacter litoralis]|uniref:Putative acyl-CoA synthetase n=1 Tax=Erythrobacter litoralis (strain HTCC2594) TaxID=314225 RepID=Q2NCU9_ERYLH|nr:acyl-CoA synthetase [Erythrobacter litoralis]ABC62492.1 putative acyl-CoA synthetase [Erythrobacter litoralis HTCC2594]
MIWHFADLFEKIASLVPDNVALIEGDAKRTWREYEDRASRLAAALVEHGIEPDAKVAIYGHNSSAFLEAQFAVFKARAVPINVNYRYVDDELVYLFDNADVDAVFFDARFAPRLAAIRDKLPKLKLAIQIEDGSGEKLEGAKDLEAVTAGHDPLPRLAYSEDDHYMVYTGGTTGMPKGVVYRQGDFVKAIAGFILGPDIEPSKEILLGAVKQLAAAGMSPIAFPACPLMHGTGMWLGGFAAHTAGGAVATLRDEKFDPDRTWEYAAKVGANVIVVVGDAFAKPLLASLRAAAERGEPYDLSRLQAIVSSGAMFSAETKLGLLEHLDIEIRDAIGSTEGSMGSSITSRAAPPSETAKFELGKDTKVFDENDEEVVPGSDAIGMIANGGFTPIAYYKDPEKSAKTFREIRGHRYSFAGDFAKVAKDGSLILLGRGSVCINTGGEKVFPEEVEEALKAHDSVWDALVVGVPDDRFGERIVAVVSQSEGHTIDQGEVIDFARTRLAGYKMPRQLVVVDEVARAANGKADYAWAKETALAAVGSDA